MQAVSRTNECNQQVLTGSYSSSFPCDQSSEYSNSDLMSLKNCLSYAVSDAGSVGLSLSDNVTLTMKNKEKLFMKFFLTDIPNSLGVGVNQFKQNILPLMYEQMVMFSRINKIIQNRICPFFIEAKGGNIHIPFDIMLYFFTNLLYYRKMDSNPEVKPTIYQQAYVRQVLLRNIDMSIKMLKGVMKPEQKISLSTYTSNYTTAYKSSELEKVKFGFILTSTMKNAQHADKLIAKLANSISVGSMEPMRDMYGNNYIDMSQKLSIVFTTLSNLLFQAAVASSALQMSKIMHNDLHSNNILVETYEPNNLQLITIYHNWNPQFKSRIYNFRTNLILKIFDFDRSVIYGGDQNSFVQNHQYFTNENKQIKCNKRDLLKFLHNILYYFISRINSDNNNEKIHSSVKPYIDNYFNLICSIFIKSSPIQIYSTSENLLYTTAPNRNMYEVFLDFLRHIPVDTRYTTQDALNRNISDRTFDAFRDPGEIADLIYSYSHSFFGFHIVPINQIISQPYILCSNMFDANGNIILNEKLRAENQFYLDYNSSLQQLYQQQQQFQQPSALHVQQ